MYSIRKLIVKHNNKTKTQTHVPLEEDTLANQIQAEARGAQDGLEALVAEEREQLVALVAQPVLVVGDAGSALRSTARQHRRVVICREAIHRVSMTVLRGFACVRGCVRRTRRYMYIDTRRNFVSGRRILHAPNK